MLNQEIEFLDTIHDEETTQRQNFGAHMEDETTICKDNEMALIRAMVLIQNAIDELKQIDQ